MGVGQVGGCFCQVGGGDSVGWWEGAAVGGWWCYISGAAVNNLFTLELYVSKHSSLPST